VPGVLPPTRHVDDSMLVDTGVTTLTKGSKPTKGAPTHLVARLLSGPAQPL
jgi:hypothetical protein